MSRRIVIPTVRRLDGRLRPGTFRATITVEDGDGSVDDAVIDANVGEMESTEQIAEPAPEPIADQISMESVDETQLEHIEPINEDPVPIETVTIMDTPMSDTTHSHRRSHCRKKHVASEFIQPMELFASIVSRTSEWTNRPSSMTDIICRDELEYMALMCARTIFSERRNTCMKIVKKRFDKVFR